MIESYAGYLEHKDFKFLNDPKENAGKGGYTIFAEMVKAKYGIDFQGKSWCTTFIFAVHPGIFGKPCTGVYTLVRRMIYHLRWRKRSYTPRYGDLIFLRNNKKEIVGHVGIVLDAYDQIIRSIEGNTVDFSGVFSPEQGGAVAIRERDRRDCHIVGYASMRGRKKP